MKFGLEMWIRESWVQVEGMMQMQSLGRKCRVRRAESQGWRFKYTESVRVSQRRPTVEEDQEEKLREAGNSQKEVKGRKEENDSK